MSYCPSSWNLMMIQCQHLKCLNDKSYCDYTRANVPYSNVLCFIRRWSSWKQGNSNGFTEYLKNYRYLFDTIQALNDFYQSSKWLKYFVHSLTKHHLFSQLSNFFISVFTRNKYRWVSVQMQLISYKIFIFKTLKIST